MKTEVGYLSIDRWTLEGINAMNKIQLLAKPLYLFFLPFSSWLPYEVKAVSFYRSGESAHIGDMLLGGGETGWALEEDYACLQGPCYLSCPLPGG
jgi:hypothetical protein